MPSLYLIYHNHDDRALLEAYGRLMVRFFGDQAADEEPLEVPSSIKSERVRVGFLSGFFYGHSHLRAFEGLIRHLDRELIDVVLIHLVEAHHDQDSERLEATCQQVVRLSTRHDEASAELRALGLDVLFFTDIGMHPRITQLASRRYAPLQVTGWGVPQTSGLPTIDAYLSSDLVEPEEAQDHYSEELIRLPGLPCCYLSDAIIDNSYNRDYFFLPPSEVLLGCLQSLEKIHPDFDDLLEQLAHRAPEAWFVFVESNTTSHTEVFLDRLARSAPSVRARLILLGRMTRAEYIGLSGCVDLLLDTIYFGSGVTLFETIYSGTPIVTLEGQFLRSRMVSAAYKQIGVSSPPIARTPEEYVALAAQLVHVPKIRTSLREEIRDKARTKLYDRMEVVRGFENFVLESIGRRVEANPCS
jgi:protein O-GlcNAc transferase